MCDQEFSLWKAPDPHVRRLQRENRGTVLKELDRGSRVSIVLGRGLKLCGRGSLWPSCRSFLRWGNQQEP